MKSLLKILLSIPVVIALYLLAEINFKLYYKPVISEEGINLDVYHQLNHLKIRRSEDAAYEMQELYPEGLMFFESLYGLAWADFLMNVEPNSKRYEEGISEINNSLTEINSEAAKAIFDSETPLNYGAFYIGWSNYLLGRKLEITSPDEWSDDDIKKYTSTCNNMANTLSLSDTPFLESYTGLSWPADMTVCMASLALHDRIFESKYNQVIEDWIIRVKSQLDSNGLIPHAANSADGSVTEGARGSSQSLILAFLPEIDPSFSKEQYAIFKELFLQDRLGLNAIREYPHGIDGHGDIDSGPVIWGIGPAATIVAHRAAIKNNDLQLAIELRNEIEAFGFPETDDSKKRFLKGYLDIADAFIVWTRSADIAVLKNHSEWWQAGFHFRSGLVLIICMLILFWAWNGRNVYKTLIQKK